VNRAHFAGIGQACWPVQALALPELTEQWPARCLSGRAPGRLDRASAGLIGREHACDGGGRCGDDEGKVALLPLSEPLPVPRRLMSQKTPGSPQPLGGNHGTADFSEASRSFRPHRIAHSGSGHKLENATSWTASWLTA